MSSSSYSNDDSSYGSGLDSPTPSDLAFIATSSSEDDDDAPRDEPSLVGGSTPPSPPEEVSVRHLKEDERKIYDQLMVGRPAGQPRRSKRSTAGQAPSVYRDPEYANLMTDGGKDTFVGGEASDSDSDDSDWAPAQGGEFAYDD